MTSRARAHDLCQMLIHQLATLMVVKVSVCDTAATGPKYVPGAIVVMYLPPRSVSPKSTGGPVYALQRMAEAACGVR